MKSKKFKVSLFEGSTYLFVGTLPLFLSINTIAIWIFVVSSFIVLGFKKRKEILWKRRAFIIPFILLFSLYIIGLWTSSNTDIALKNISRVLTLLLLPTIILSHNKEDFNFKKIYYSLGAGLLTGMLICWGFVIESILTNATPLRQAPYFFEWIYSNWNLVKPIGVHPNYFALLIVILVLAIIKTEELKFLRKNKLKLILLLIPFFLFLFELSSRVAMLAFVLVIIVSVLQNRSRKKGILIGLFIVGLIVLSVKFDYLGNKFSGLVDGRGNIKVERIQRWDFIIREFKKEDKLILGVGSGDTEEIYTRAYINGNFKTALIEGYNAHNQFVEFLVSNGFFGLLVFVWVLLFFALKTKLKGEALSFFITIVLLSFIESFLGRAKGVFIFSFFISFFLLMYSDKLIKNE
ncbi:MAG: O-antigen ligase family protein [Flavobacteriaceae bacterium]|nr:O-antigen ligase family protein [Flavobacteriaceae bacterium]